MEFLIIGSTRIKLDEQCAMKISAPILGIDVTSFQMI